MSFTDIDWLIPRVAEGTPVITFDAQQPLAAPEVGIAQEAPPAQLPSTAAPGA